MSAVRTTSSRVAIDAMRPLTCWSVSSAARPRACRSNRTAVLSADPTRVARSSMNSRSSALNGLTSESRMSCIAPNVPSVPTRGTVITEPTPAWRIISPSRQIEHPLVDMRDEFASSRPNDVRRTPGRLRVVRKVALHLFSPLHLGRIAMSDPDQRSLRWAIHRHHDRTPLGHIWNHRGRDPSEDLLGVHRQREDIVHAGDELHPLTSLPFQFDEAVAFIDLTMSVVDVHCQPERTDHLAVVDEDFADALDPMDGPVRPDASMVESERCRIPHRVGDGRSHPVAVGFVDQLDPTVEGANEPAVTQSEQRAQVAVPHDLTGTAGSTTIRLFDPSRARRAVDLLAEPQAPQIAI